MALMVDTHAHLDFPQFKGDLDAVLERARRAGVGPIINVGTCEQSSCRTVSLSKRHGGIWAAVGVHPHYTAGVTPGYRKLLTGLAQSDRVLAIGETGLDYYRNLSPPDVQLRLFREHLEIAVELGKPVIIHSRNAHADTLAVLREAALPLQKGVMHCFSGEPADAYAFLDMGFYISLAGPVTYPRSHLMRSLLKEIPPDRLLLETDAPYLSPQPYRSMRNEPAFVKATYERVALELALEPEHLARLVMKNARTLFSRVLSDDIFIPPPA